MLPQLVAAEQFKGLEVRQVANGIWEPPQLEQVKCLESCQTSKGIWEPLPLVAAEQMKGFGGSSSRQRYLGA